MLGPYRVIAIGVNNAAGQTPLSFAESDARAIFQTFTGALGPALAQDSALLLGARATKAEVLRVLGAAARVGTGHLLLYFSGHGDSGGICLADDVLEHRVLRDALKRVRSRATLVVLDACQAASYAWWHKTGEDVAGIAEDWADMLANASPGTRMFFATSADELSREGGNVRGGHFTWALLAALHRGYGSIQGRQRRWVSDHEAFSLACDILRQRCPNDAQPESRKLDGDFPMLLSQADNVCGSGVVCLTAAPRGITANVNVHVSDRRGIRTRLQCSVKDRSGFVVGIKNLFLTPASDSASYELSVAFPRDEIWDDKARSRLRRGVEVPLWWTAELLDAHHGHSLDAAAQRINYRRTASAA